MKIWQFINDKLDQKQAVILLYVLDSRGSSPGRQGFKMAIAEDNEIKGTIGGGIMEHKLVEHSRVRLKNKETEILLKPQFHNKEHAKNQSGMICSGNQFIASIPLRMNDKSKVKNVLAAFRTNKNDYLFFDSKGWEVQENANFLKNETKLFHYNNEEDWSYNELVLQSPVIHIFGGGHVGLALSEVMSLLGFHIKIYDDRSELNTLEQNQFAHEKNLLDYEKLQDSFKSTETDYVAIMTFGYRTDKLILKQLIHNKFAYLGMMGSEAKVRQLLQELEAEGLAKEKLAEVKTPIGINIFSKTTMEIAISVGAEIIKEKNKDLPTGRTKIQRNYEKR